MHRRSFIKAAASLGPAAGMHDLLARHAQAQPAPAPHLVGDAPHIVGNGEDRFGAPHPMQWSSLLFKVSSGETAGGLFVIEHRHLHPGGPPLHLHFSQEEWFYVIEGEVAFQVGEQRLHLRAGESVLAPRRIPHTFSSVSPAPSRMLIAFCPAGKMEQYFLDAGKPGVNAGAPDFMNRYEMQWVGPSPFLKS